MFMDLSINLPLVIIKKKRKFGHTQKKLDPPYRCSFIDE
jgi:hypothetical protein